MKNLKILSILLTVVGLLFTSCGEDLSVAPSTDINHRIIVTSEMNFENTISENGHIDFGDISKGVVSRTWTMPGGTDVSVIAQNGASTSSEEIIKGIFYKPGVYEVTLNQTFGGDVYPNDDSTEPINSRELDTTIVVTVLDSLRADIKLYYINDDGTTGAELVLADDAENELTASKSVRLTYTAVGEEDNVTWSSEGGKPASETTTLNEFDMRFNKLGSWDLDFLASRTRPRDADTISYEKIIKVIPSTEPVLLENVLGEDGKIVLQFSRDMDGTSLDPDDFTVRLENGGNTFNPTVASATIDSDEAINVVLELDGETLFSDDTAFISYTPGNMRTADLVDATAFTDAELTGFIFDNLLETTAYDYTLENSTSDDWPDVGWGGVWAMYNRDLISSEQARSGSNSLKVAMDANGGMIIQHSNNFTLESGKDYVVGMWIYVESGVANAPTGTQAPDIRLYSSNWAITDLVPTTFGTNLPIGEWFYRSVNFSSTFSGDVTWLIRGHNEFNPDPLTFYIDDIEIAERSIRP